MTNDSNPVLQSWETPFGLPPFERVRPEHFAPALEAAMRAHRGKINAIAPARSASQRNSVGCEAVRADRSPARGPCEPVATRGRASAARARPSGLHARRRAAIVTCEKTSRGNRRAPCDLDNTVQPERPRRCEVLDADGFSAFVEAGNAFDTTLAERLRHNVYAAGGTADPAVAYRAFRGREPSVEPMLARAFRGREPSVEPMPAHSGLIE